MENKFEKLVNRGRLKEELYNNGLTLKKLAEVFGITQQQMTNKMRGESKFSENEIKYLYDTFGSSIFF